MSITVPRQSEARVRASARARIGDAAAEKLERSARRNALDYALAEALESCQSPEGLARFCEMAARNLDMSTKCLLEAIGQDAPIGILRTRAWVLRNGAAIRKGERGYAVSMFGAYVFAGRQMTRSFGDIGSAVGFAPECELDGYSELAGDRIAGAILCAIRGCRLAAVTAPVTIERLERALAAARGVVQAITACLSCEGAGCVACSCHDDRCPQLAVLSSRAMNGKARIGRPPKEREPIPAVVKAAKAREAAKRTLERADAAFAEAMREAIRDGASYKDVAASADITAGRVHQIVSS